MSVQTGGALRLSDVRAWAAAALAPSDDGDPDVLVNIVDAAEPPCLMLLYDDPWLEPMTNCLWTCRLEVLAIASRVEPGPGVERLEQLVEYTLRRLQADSYPWPAANVSAPRVFTIGGVPLLGARLSYHVRIAL